jgi:Dioxygenase
MQNELNRRDVLKTAGGVGLAAIFGPRALQLLGDDAEAASTCLLTPEVTEGPYWVANRLTRRNITEGKPGVPLVIRFTVLNAKTCKPIRNADVEIWHCDALGNYSAVNGASTRYLRGHQKSNAVGKAEFLTIFPGWYRGRTPHIHMKVSVGATPSTPARSSSTRRSPPPSTSSPPMRGTASTTRRTRATTSTGRRAARPPSSS